MPYVYYSKSASNYEIPTSRGHTTRTSVLEHGRTFQSKTSEVLYIIESSATKTLSGLAFIRYKPNQKQHSSCLISKVLFCRFKNSIKFYSKRTKQVSKFSSKAQWLLAQTFMGITIGHKVFYQ